MIDHFESVVVNGDVWHIGDVLGSSCSSFFMLIVSPNSFHG